MKLVGVPPQKLIGRFAPSPTGTLHFGSLVAAVGSYCLARRAGGGWLLRMEDLDRPRVVPGAAETMLKTLEQFGFSWDGEVVWQSRRLERYQQVLDELVARGLVFDCACTRREILASAPHPGEEGPVYPGTCRNGLPGGRQPRAQRLKVTEPAICFSDGVFGRVEQHLASVVGDFVLKRADGIFAYQLAVVVDDFDSGVNQVVRGGDLLASTPRQIHLCNCLGYPVPAYVHLPLAINAAGDKISKRLGSAPVAVETAGDWLVAALRFLGQDVPGELVSAPAPEILSWACRHFSRRRIPTGPAIPPEGME
jgi:glutamyl-Q tRNA(Asp) synthetase